MHSVLPLIREGTQPGAYPTAPPRYSQPGTGAPMTSFQHSSPAPAPQQQYAPATPPPTQYPGTPTQSYGGQQPYMQSQAQPYQGH